MRPNYKHLGLSSPMGPRLRELVEEQLLADLLRYGVNWPGLRFDWSESCPEGHDASFLDSHLENYSGIAVFDAYGYVVAEGWMDFVLVGDLLLVYWDFLDSWPTGAQVTNKDKPGIPDHIWQQMPAEAQRLHAQDRMKLYPFSQRNH